MGRKTPDRVSDVLPVGRLAAIHRGPGAQEVVGEPLCLPAGPLRELLTVVDQPLEELVAGTRLRVGQSAVVELTGHSAAAADAGGLREAAAEASRLPASAPYPACVVVGGTIQPGDAVWIDAVPVPLEDALDLHPFRPDEIPGVVGEYLTLAHAAGLREVRLIHGRGRGVQRAVVRRVLAASPLVVGFADAPPAQGGWGATLVELSLGSGPAP